MYVDLTTSSLKHFLKKSISWKGAARAEWKSLGGPFYGRLGSAFTMLPINYIKKSTTEKQENLNLGKKRPSEPYIRPLFGYIE